MQVRGRLGPLAQRRNLERCFAQVVIKRCTNFGGAVVNVLQMDTKLLEWCQVLKQQSIAMTNFILALVWRCLCRTNARYHYANSIAMLASAGCWNFVPLPYRSRNATTTFVRWDQGFKITWNFIGSHLSETTTVHIIMCLVTASKISEKHVKLQIFQWIMETYWFLYYLIQ